MYMYSKIIIVPVVLNLITQINPNDRRISFKRERTPQEKITRLEKAKRSLAYFVMHATFLCSGLTFFYMLYDILKFKAKTPSDTELSWLLCFLKKPTCLVIFAVLSVPRCYINFKDIPGHARGRSISSYNSVFYCTIQDCFYFCAV